MFNPMTRRFRLITALPLLLGLSVLWPSTTCLGGEADGVSWALLKSPLAKQMGLPARLQGETTTRLESFIADVEEAISCGRESCAHWESDSGPILLALASFQELRSRGENSLHTVSQIVVLLAALEVVLHEPAATNPGAFLEEREATRGLLRTLAAEVLQALPVHPSTLRAMSESRRLEGGSDEANPWRERYLKRRPTDPLGITPEERTKKAREGAAILMKMLDQGEREAALEVMEDIAEHCPRTPASDYVMALSSLFERDALGVLEALRRFELRGGSTSAVKAEVHRLGALVARRARLTGPEKSDLNALLELTASEELACSPSGTLMVSEISLPCTAHLSREEAQKRLGELVPIARERTESKEEVEKQSEEP